VLNFTDLSRRKMTRRKSILILLLELLQEIRIKRHTVIDGMSLI
jgi:hypothetical protein